MADTVYYRKKIKRSKSIYARLKEDRKFQNAMTIVLPVLFGILIFTLWQTHVLHAWFHTDTFTLPVPTKIAKLFGENKAAVLENMRSTVFVSLVGLIGGSIIGYLVAVIASVFPNMGKGGLNIIGAFASIPVIALAPVMTNWTRNVSPDANTRSTVAKIIVVMMIAAADMCLNAFRGLTELKPYSEDLMKTYAASKFTIFVKLRLPNSIPYIFTALKVSVPASIMTAIVSEYFAEYIIGVGREIRENIVLSQYSIAWVYITAACIIGIVSYIILMIIQSIALKRYRD